jgi:hypothetical protein
LLLFLFSLLVGGVTEARADLPGFSFTVEQADRNVLIHAETSGHNFYIPHCDFTISRKKGDWGYVEIYDGELPLIRDEDRTECYPTGDGSEYCDTRTYLICTTFVDVCPEPGQYVYRLETLAPQYYQDPTRLVQIQSIDVVQSSTGSCDPPANGIWSRVPDQGCSGCSTGSRAGLAHLAVLGLLLLAIWVGARRNP